MPKPTLTLDEYIVESNRRLQKHKLYRSGMRVVRTPAGATGHAVGGYEITECEITDFDTKGIYAEVARQISDEFDLRT
jgi:hypothetical protein